MFQVSKLVDPDLVRRFLLQDEFGLQAVQSALPPGFAAYDSGVDQQSLPAARRRTIGFGGWLRRVVIQRVIKRVIQRAEQFVLGRDPSRRPGGFRNLTKRQVFREARGRKPLRGAQQQCKKCAAGRVRTGAPPAKPCRNPGSPQRILDHGLVTIRVAKQNRHLIERYTFLR